MSQPLTFGRKLPVVREPQDVRAALLRHLIQHAIRRKEDGELLSPSGRPISWLIDLKGALLQGTALDDVATLFWDEFESKLPFQIGGMEVAAVPLVAALLMKGIERGHQINGFMVRKERKRYGRARSIEGALSTDPIIIVDDITNSGKSLEKVRVILEQEGRQIDRVFSVVDFRSRTGLEWRRQRRISVASLYTPAMFGLNLLSSPAGSRVGSAPLRAEWTFHSPGGNPFFVVPKSAPIVDGDHVYFGSDSGTFRCVQAGTGMLQWEFKTSDAGRKGIWSTAAIYGEHVFFGAYDGNMYCLSKADGSLVWVNHSADWIGSSPAIAPALNLVFIGMEYERPNSKGGLVALDLATGEKRWEVPTREYLHGSPRYDPHNGIVIVGTNDDTVLAVDAMTGAARWQFSASGAIKHGIALSSDGVLAIFGSFDGHLYVIEAATGIERYRVDTRGAIYSTPLIVGSTIFVGSASKKVFSVELETGKILKEIGLRSKTLCSPAYIDDRVYIGANDGTVLALDPKTFDATVVFTAPDAVTNAVACSDKHNKLVVMTAMNQLFSLSYHAR